MEVFAFTVDDDLTYKAYNIFGNTVLMKSISEYPFNHISDFALGTCNTDIKGHLGYSVHLFAGIIPLQKITHLRPVTMGYHKFIAVLQQENQVFKRSECIFLLFFNGSTLIIAL